MMGFSKALEWHKDTSPVEKGSGIIELLIRTGWNFLAKTFFSKKCILGNMKMFHEFMLVMWVVDLKKWENFKMFCFYIF